MEAGTWSYKHRELQWSHMDLLRVVMSLPASIKSHQEDSESLKSFSGGVGEVV